MPTTTLSEILATAQKADFGRPAARKSGRDPRWPYVPVVIRTDDAGRSHVAQVLGLAFATRDEALAAAENHIAACRSDLARKLVEPRNRALRESYGLPREIQDVAS